MRSVCATGQRLRISFRIGAGSLIHAGWVGSKSVAQAGPGAVPQDPSGYGEVMAAFEEHHDAGERPQDRGRELDARAGAGEGRVRSAACETHRAPDSHPGPEISAWY